MLGQRNEKRRWPRSQRFALSEKGLEAESAYRAGIVSARDLAGRASFDAARATWAAQFRVDPDDGVFLGECRSGPVRVSQLGDAVESSGKTLRETLAALGRLVDGGYIFTLDP